MKRSMMSRRTFLKWVGIGSASTLLTSCVAPVAPSSETAGAGASTAAEPTQISFLYADGPPTKEKLDAMVGAFMDSNPEVEVEIIWTPWSTGGQAGFEQKLPAMYAGGDAPDFHQIDDDYIPQFAFKGMLQPIDDLLDERMEREEYPDLTWNLTTAMGNKIFAFVLALKPRLYFYNVDMFEEAGITAPTSWDDAWSSTQLLEAARALTHDDVFGFSWEYWVWNTFQDANDNCRFFSEDFTEYLLPDSPEPFQFIADLAYKEKVSPPYDVQTQVGNRSLFISKKLAIYSSGVWENRVLNEAEDLNFDVMPYAKIFDHALSEASLFTFALRQGAPSAAVDFAIYTVGDEAQALLAEGGDLLPNKMSQWQGEAFTAASQPANKHLFADSISRQGRWPFLVNGAEIRSQIRPMVDLIWAGQETAAVALEQTRSKVMELLVETAVNCGKGCS
jgi:multiple sugar transport system substrate-binding protein